MGVAPARIEAINVADKPPLAPSVPVDNAAGSSTGS